MQGLGGWGGVVNASQGLMVLQCECPISQESCHTKNGMSMERLRWGGGGGVKCESGLGSKVKKIFISESGFNALKSLGHFCL